MGRKKSYIRNKGNHTSHFKAGHPLFFQRTSAQVTSSEATTLNEQNALKTASRIKSFELPDMLSVASTSSHCGEPGVLAYELRPEKGDTYSQCLDNHDKRNICGYSENENIIVNVKQLEELFCAFASHKCEASESGSVSIHIVERQGLSVSVVAKCNKCEFNA